MFINGEPVLADPGLLADMRESVSRVGTPGYEPPEHHGTPQGDIFSLGQTLYRASTGRGPDEPGFSPCREAEVEDPRFWRWLSIVARACSADPPRRYRSAKGLLKDLRKLRRQGAGRRLWKAAALLLATVVVLHSIYQIYQEVKTTMEARRTIAALKKDLENLGEEIARTAKEDEGGETTEPAEAKRTAETDAGEAAGKLARKLDALPQGFELMPDDDPGL